jgi:hypothetical protein
MEGIKTDFGPFIKPDQNEWLKFVWKTMPVMYHAQPLMEKLISNTVKLRRASDIFYTPT